MQPYGGEASPTMGLASIRYRLIMILTVRARITTMGNRRVQCSCIAFSSLNAGRAYSRSAFSLWTAILKQIVSGRTPNHPPPSRCNTWQADAGCGHHLVPGQPACLEWPLHLVSRSSANRRGTASGTSHEDYSDGDTAGRCRLADVLLSQGHDR